MSETWTRNCKFHKGEKSTVMMLTLQQNPYFEIVFNEVSISFNNFLDFGRW